VFYPRGHPLRARLADHPDVGDFVGEYRSHHFSRSSIPLSPLSDRFGTLPLDVFAVPPVHAFGAERVHEVPICKLIGDFLGGHHSYSDFRGFLWTRRRGLPSDLRIAEYAGWRFNLSLSASAPASPPPSLSAAASSPPSSHSGEDVAPRRPIAKPAPKRAAPSRSHSARARAVRRARSSSKPSPSELMARPVPPPQLPLLEPVDSSMIFIPASVPNAVSSRHHHAPVAQIPRFDLTIDGSASPSWASSPASLLWFLGYRFNQDRTLLCLADHLDSSAADVYAVADSIPGVPDEDWSVPRYSSEVADLTEFGDARWQGLREMFGTPSWGVVSPSDLHHICSLPPMSHDYPSASQPVYRLDLLAASEPPGLPLVPPPSAIRDSPDDWELIANVPFIRMAVSDNGVPFRLPVEWHLWFGVWLYHRCGSEPWDPPAPPALPWEERVWLRAVSLLRVPGGPLSFQ
jgi:hypothetical protein